MGEGQIPHKPLRAAGDPHHPAATCIQPHVRRPGLAHILGFRPLTATFFFALAGIVVIYLVLVETGKYWFFRFYHAPATPAPRHRRRGYRVHRRAGRFTARTLHPAGRPDPDQADRKLPAPASAACVPGDAPGAPLDGKHGTSAPTA
jgi:hypothetical protein